MIKLKYQKKKYDRLIRLQNSSFRKKQISPVSFRNTAIFFIIPEIFFFYVNHDEDPRFLSEK